MLISIHALREEGDQLFIATAELVSVISIHALREEGDVTSPRRKPMNFNFYPRPPRGGRRGGLNEFGQLFGISIHALREEGDALQEYYPPILIISIHALREEGDTIAKVDGTAIKISIHALREEGDVWAADCEKVVIEFLSTPSARRATGRTVFRARNRWISIHALREEGDRPSQTCCSCSANFYPRPPRGGRPII